MRPLGSPGGGDPLGGQGAGDRPESQPIDRAQLEDPAHGLDPLGRAVGEATPIALGNLKPLATSERSKRRPGFVQDQFGAVGLETQVE